MQSSATDCPARTEASKGELKPDTQLRRPFRLATRRHHPDPIARQPPAPPPGGPDLRPGHVSPYVCLASRKPRVGTRHVSPLHRARRPVLVRPCRREISPLTALSPSRPIRAIGTE